MSHGWSWGLPVCWQGWMVLALFYLLLACAGFLWMPRHPAHFVLSCVVLCGLLLAVCYLKGEKLRWRWGKDQGNVKRLKR